MGDRIVQEWLMPLNLQHYTQAFLDNGYDDLEVCKQIGEPDLDAIGVLDPGHRKIVLDAVEVLRKDGGSAVYFTLENPDYERFACDRLRSETGAVSRQQDSHHSPSRKAFFTYPRLQVTALLQERLFEDDLHLNEQPYTDESGKSDAEAMQHLASRYADQLNAPLKDVLDRLEELRTAALCPDGSHSSETELEPESPGQGPYSMISVYGQSPRSAPPPLPPLSSFQMSCLYVDPIELEQNIDETGSSYRIPRSSLTPSTSTDPSNAGSELGGTASELSVKESVGLGNTIGRLFRSVTLRRPTKKYTYHQHEGDLNASEIMMSEDERIQLMILVKEGRLSIDEALEMVKNHRRERQPMEDFDQHDVKSSIPLSSSCPTESVKMESISGHRDSRSKVAFGSPFFRQKGNCTKESERLSHCFIPLSHRKKSDAFECRESPKIKSFGWSPPPLPPIPRNSGIIVESFSAECMLKYKSSSLKCSPLLSSKNGDIQPSLPVRKSRSLHSSVPPQMALNCSNEDSDDCTLRTRSHHYENVRRSDGQEIARMMDISRNGSSFGARGQPEHGSEWNDWAAQEDDKDPDGTLTNAGQKVLLKTVRSREHCLNKDEGVRPIGQNGHRSRTRRRQLKDREEPETSSTDSLTNALNSGLCGISSSSSHSSMSNEEEQIPKLAYVSRVKAKVDYIPSPGDDLEALTLKKGDIIYVLGVLDSRWCRGILNNKIGTFRSMDVDPVSEEGIRMITPRHIRSCKVRRQQRRPKPKTVEELLSRLGLQHLTHVFLQHGFHTLDDFSELDEVDLNELKVTNPEERVKLLTAAQLLLDTEQNDFDSYSRSASQSPALSQDASSQTVLTHFCARDRSDVASALHADGFTNTLNMNPVSDTSNDRSGMRYPSETSSDDQEILSITNNGTITISWGENNSTVFAAPGSGTKMHPLCSGVSQSDSSISSSGDSAAGSHRFVKDMSPANGRNFRCSTTSTQTGLKLPAGSGRRGASETQTQTVRCPNAALFRKTSTDGACDQFDPRKQELASEKNGPLSYATSGGTAKNSVSGSNVVSSPLLFNGSAVVAVKVNAVPSVKTAHVRQLVTSSPLHSIDAHKESLDCHGAYAIGLPTVSAADDGSERCRFSQGFPNSAFEQQMPSLQDLLSRLGLSDYISEFAYCGLTTSEDLLELDEVKLKAIGIENLNHIQLLLKTIDSLKYSHNISAVHESVLTDGRPVERALEIVVETQVDPSSLEAANLQNSRFASKISPDNNRASSKTRPAQRQSTIVDKV